MSGTALSEQALRDSLLDIRLPAGGALDPVADLLLAGAFGALAALVVVGLARLVSRRRTRPPGASVADRVAVLRTLPDDARRIGFLHLLKDIAPDRYAELRPKLYRPDAGIDPEEEVLARV